MDRPDSSQNFMDTAKTMVFIQINNTVVFTNHTLIKLIKKSETKKPVNSKPKVLSNNMFCISRFRTMNSHRKTERIGSIMRHQICFS